MRLLIIILLCWSALCQAQSVVRVGTGYVLPPYVIKETESGLELDIIRAALAASDLNMEIHFLPPARALFMVRSHELDAVTTVNEGVGSAGYWSDSHIHYQNFAITLQKRGLKLHRLDDLSGLTVAAFQNARMSLGAEFRRQIPRLAEYREYPDQSVQNKMLYSGRVDVVIADRLIFEQLKGRLGHQFDTSQPLIFHPLFPPTEYKVLFNSPRLRDRFNQGLAEIRRNGQYQQIVRRYTDSTK